MTFWQFADAHPWFALGMAALAAAAIANIVRSISRAFRPKGFRGEETYRSSDQS
jgi:hypothetical protein